MLCYQHAIIIKDLLTRLGCGWMKSLQPNAKSEKILTKKQKKHLGSKVLM
jgi:hypothetical protein